VHRKLRVERAGGQRAPARHPLLACLLSGAELDQLGQAATLDQDDVDLARIS